MAIFLAAIEANEKILYINKNEIPMPQPSHKADVINYVCLTQNIRA
jgi:hypothetical protein